MYLMNVGDRLVFGWRFPLQLGVCLLNLFFDTLKAIRSSFNHPLIIFCGADVADMSDFFGDHAEFLKIDKAIYIRVIAIVDERQVFLEDWIKWNLKSKS